MLYRGVMKAILILALAGLTSVGTYLGGTRRLGLPARTFSAAIGIMLESVGTILVFLVINLAVVVTTVLAVRGPTGMFISAYVVTDDIVWVGLSLLQGLTFQQ